jgi:hypothetical protein
VRAAPTYSVGTFLVQAWAWQWCMLLPQQMPAGHYVVVVWSKLFWTCMHLAALRAGWAESGIQQPSGARA